MLVAYNRWANEAVLAAAAALSPERLAKSAGASFDSIHGTLAHILSAQTIWLARWTKRTPPRFTTEPLEALRAAFAASHDGLEAFAASMSATDWARPIPYTDTSGAPWTVPLGTLITHVVNHGTFHRGEAGLLLAAEGCSPGDLDFVYWARDTVGT